MLNLQLQNLLKMILTTIDQFRAVVPTVTVDIDFADLKPYCNSAELWFKNQVLGTTLYEYVEALGNTPSGTDADLQQLCLNIVANHAYWDAIPFLDLTHTNSGFGVINNNNKAPASKERVERLRKQCLIRRDNEIENLILFLEQNAVYHDDWKGSPVYSILTDCLIPTADQMEKHSGWTGTREQFLQLKPRLIHLTRAKIEPLFSKNLIEELIESHRDNDLTGDESILLDMLRHVLGAMFDENRKVAGQLAADALRFVDENEASFPLYFNSKEYEARTTPVFENDRKSTIFSSIM